MLTCSACGTPQENVNELEVHIKMDHLDWYPYQCELCGVKRLTAQQISGHMGAVHSQTTEYTYRCFHNDLLATQFKQIMSLSTAEDHDSTKCNEEAKHNAVNPVPSQNKAKSPQLQQTQQQRILHESFPEETVQEEVDATSESGIPGEEISLTSSRPATDLMTASAMGRGSTASASAYPVPFNLESSRTRSGLFTPITGLERQLKVEQQDLTIDLPTKAVATVPKVAPRPHKTVECMKCGKPVRSKVCMNHAQVHATEDTGIVRYECRICKEYRSPYANTVRHHAVLKHDVSADSMDELNKKCIIDNKSAMGSDVLKIYKECFGRETRQKRRWIS